MSEVYVAYVGWRREDLSLGDADRIRSAKRVLLSTARCGCAAYLREMGVPFDTLDDLFEGAADFDALAQSAAARVLAMEEGVFCVPSNADRAARIALSEGEGRVWASDIRLYAGTPRVTVAASDAETFLPDARTDTIVTELTTRVLASEMKLKLMEKFSPDARIVALYPGEKPVYARMSDLDRLTKYDHRLVALARGEAAYDRRGKLDLADLESILRILRAPDGCPWDREQTHESLRKYLLEEAYESADAIDRGDDDDLCEELGDVLFQIAFHAQIASEHGAYELSDVVDGVCKKMLARHRHVFGGEKAETSEEVAALWQRVKRAEKGRMCEEKGLGVARALPALTFAGKIVSRAKEYGLQTPAFDDTPGGRLFRLLWDAEGADLEGALRASADAYLKSIGK